MNPEDPLAEQILGIQLIPSLPKLGLYHIYRVSNECLTEKRVEESFHELLASTVYRGR